MTGLLQDLRFALRQLRKTPGFTGIAILMLALGICANSTVFSWMNGTMLHPIPGANDPGNLVSIDRGAWSSSPMPPLSYPDYRDLRERNHTLSGMLAYHHDWLSLTDGTAPERIYVANTSWNYFDVLGVKPELGRFFRPDEEASNGGVPYIVLSHSLWQSRYMGDPTIVGKSIEVARHAVTVIGVTPEGFIGAMPGIRQDAWLPLDPGTGDVRLKQRGGAWLNVLGRLNTGVSRQRATEDLETLMRQLVAEYPNEHPGVNTITVDPMWRSPFGANVYLAGTLPILLVIAGVVLLLTCANVATLVLVRFVSRRREIAIRQSLGAGRFELMRQMILEGLIFSLGGGMLAFLITAWTSMQFARILPPNASPLVMNGSMDRTVTLLILLLAVLASAICGALPAWRSSNVPAAEVLKEEAASVSGGGHNRHLLSGLVVVQIALSLALLICSGLFLRTLRNMAQSDPGFDRDHILTATVGLSIAGYPPAEENAIQHKILDRVAALPGVTVASLTDWTPLSFDGKSTQVFPEGYVPQLHESDITRRADVTAGYFQSMGMKILSGRDFARDDNETAPRVVIVDQTAANHYWPGQEPIGRHLTIFGRPFTVVGEVNNIKHQLMNERPEPMVYMSYFQNSDETIVQVRTSGDPNAMAMTVEQTIHEIDNRLAVFDVRSMRETTLISSVFAILESTFATIFALIALVLAAIGIYGVVAYRTQMRTHEIGLRMALGASRRDVLRLVLMQGLRLTAVGLVLGLVLAFGLTRFMSGLLYGVSANDPLTVVSVVALLGAIAVLACYLPAFRAMRINPVQAMREQ